MITRGFLYALSRIQFDTLNNYYEDMEKSIEETQGSQLEHLQELVKEYPEHEHDIFWDYNSDHVRELLNDYPNLLRASVLIAAISNLEYTMVKIHGDLRKDTDFKIENYQDKKFKNYSTVEKVIRSINETIPMGELLNSSEWKDLSIFIKVRNQVVHNNGVIHPKHKRTENLYAKLQTYEEISFNEYDEIIFKVGFPSRVIKNCLKNIDALLQTIKKYKQDLRAK